MALVRALLACCACLCLAAQAAAGEQADVHGQRGAATPAPFPASAWGKDGAALVQLGRLLFHDRALSVNGSLACADCHRQELAFTDGRTVAHGATGELHTRNTPSLANVACMASLGWSDPSLWQLEAQHRIPLFGHAPLEMGMTDPLPPAVVQRLRTHPRYRAAFAAVAAEQGGADLDTGTDTVVRAIAAFVRTLVSSRSPFDAWLYGDDARALSVDARAGFALFESERLGCGGCHGGFLLGGAVRGAGMQQAPQFASNGLPLRASDTGLAQHTGDPRDRGLFRVPSLRNVALTAPYMHDGSLATLEDVIDHYERAGARAAAQPQAGVPQAGLRLFTLGANERRQLLAFLGALTDDVFTHDAAFTNPW